MKMLQINIKQQHIAMFIVLVAWCLFMAAPVFAGVDYDANSAGIFDKMYNWMAGMLTGSGGKIIALIALVASAVTGAMGYYKTAIGIFVVFILTLAGPSVIDGAYSAIW